MKKIIFADIPMKEISLEKDAQCYAGTGNANCTYGGKVIFPINAVLAEKLCSKDEVKVVLLKTQTEKGNSNKNADLFQQELNGINAGIGSKIRYESLETDFVEPKQNHETRLRAMLTKLENGSELYADIKKLCNFLCRTSLIIRSDNIHKMYTMCYNSSLRIR